MKIKLPDVTSKIKGLKPKVTQVKLTSLIHNPLTGKQAGLGVDIGARYIKMVQVAGAGKGVQIMHYGSIRTPQDLFLSAEFQPEMLAAELERMIQELDLKKSKISISVGGNKIITRHIRMPEMQPKELETAIKWESEKYIPVPVDELVLDHVDLGLVDHEGVKQSRILLAAMTKENARMFHQAFSLANLPISAIDLAAFAIWRVFVGWPPDFPPDVTAIVDIGFAGSQMVVVDEGKIIFTRTMPVGARTIFDTLARNQQMDQNEITRIMESGTAGSREAAQEAATGADNVADPAVFLSAGMSDFAREVRRSLEFVRNQEKKEIAGMIITGGTSNFAGIDGLLADELKLPVELGNIDIPIKDQPGEKIDPSYTVALGQALREVID